MSQLVLGLPDGSLQNSTVDLLDKAGWRVNVSSRNYRPSINDDEIVCRLLRPQEMSRYVEAGKLDVGITGLDWVMENGSDVVVIDEFGYAKQKMVKPKWVLAVPAASPVQTAKDLDGKIVAAELLNVTTKWFKDQGINARVERSWGATESKPPDLADAIVDVTETGSSLRANNLRIVDVILESTTQIIMNKTSAKDAWKRRKIENITRLMEGAILAQYRVGLKLNVPPGKMDAVRAVLDGHSLDGATESPLLRDGWFALEVIVPEVDVRAIIPQLLDAGARGIVEYPLNKIIL